MTLERLVAAIRVTRTYDLGVALEAGIPHGPAHSPFLFSLIKKHGQIVYRDGVSTATDVFSMGTHVGTHIDALGHVSKAGRLHGGIEAESVQSFAGGLRHGGVHDLPPIIGRGILLDVPAVRGVDVLPAEDAVTARDLERACELHGVTVEPGDTVLVRTGWMRYWADPERYHGTPVPGLVVDAAHWIADRHARCVGGDTYAVEKVPAHGMAVHVALLVERGVPIIEMLDLEALARDGVHAFLFVALPLKIVGATGSPVRPIALVMA
jgi:kynurenine formamidase